MSEVTVMCPYCEASLTGDSDFLGEEVGCPDCGNSFIARISPGSYGGSEPGAESVSASLKRFRFNPEAFKNIGAMSAAESYEGQQDPNDSVFTDTERGVKRPAAYRRQNLHKSGFPAAENRTSRPAAYRRQAESFARPSHAAASVPPAKRSIPATGRKKQNFEQRFGLGDVHRVFKLNTAFWTFFSLGVIIFSLGVFIVFDASGYDGAYKDWGGSGIRVPDLKGKKEIPVGESSYAAARNTVVLSEGLKYINRNIANVGDHYQGLHEMFVGFMLVLGSGFFFFCALIAFLYSAKLPEEKSSE